MLPTATTPDLLATLAPARDTSSAPDNGGRDMGDTLAFATHLDQQRTRMERAQPAPNTRRSQDMRAARDPNTTRDTQADAADANSAAVTDSAGDGDALDFVSDNSHEQDAANRAHTQEHGGDSSAVQTPAPQTQPATTPAAVLIRTHGTGAGSGLARRTSRSASDGSGLATGTKCRRTCRTAGSRQLATRRQPNLTICPAGTACRRCTGSSEHTGDPGCPERQLYGLARRASDAGSRPPQLICVHFSRRLAGSWC